jgi:hypothetical protein
VFTIIRRCVARKNYVDISKVKVTIWVWRSKMAINELIRAITLSFIVGFKNHLAHLFTIIRLCVARKNYVDISKVKVTVWVWRSKMAINELVRAITLWFIVRFIKHLAHFFTIIRRCVARKNNVDISKIKVTIWVWRSKMAINELVWAITMSFVVRF